MTCAAANLPPMWHMARQMPCLRAMRWPFRHLRPWRTKPWSLKWGCGLCVPWQARRVRDLVAERIGTPLSLREMAEAAGLSEGYFVRAFKGTFGVTPYQYVLRERVTLAQSLIRSGTVSLREAAERVEFLDARRMGRTFRKMIGRSPTEAARLQRA